MNKNFYVKSLIFTGNGTSEGVLCECETDIRFRQSFERGRADCNELNFETELAALEFIRKLYPERQLTVLEDTGKILTTWAHETSFSTMQIKKYRGNND